ncbi:MAG: DUF1499 domain-containing protein [Pseudomonadota bacterium]
MLLDFANLTPPRWPNHCLAAPADWDGPKGEIATEVYPVPLEKLREALVAVAAAEPRTNLLRLDKEALQAEFEQRSKLFGFRDSILVEFMEAGKGASTLAIYSRARVGLIDLGVNRRRVERWLAALGERLAAA